MTANGARQTQKTKPVFFYGLFMDEQLLKEKGLCPRNVRCAYADAYQLRIGARATLAPQEGACAYGTVVELNESEVQTLYQDESVKDYVPQRVQAHTVRGDTLDAIAYILSAEKLAGNNAEYAVELANVAKKLNLPDFYVTEIESWV